MDNKLDIAYATSSSEISLSSIISTSLFCSRGRFASFLSEMASPEAPLTSGASVWVVFV